MIYWFELHKPSYEVLENDLQRMDELDCVYHLGWEEAWNNLDQLFGQNGTDKINDLMIQLSNKHNKKIMFYNITCSNPNYTESIPYQGEEHSHIKVVHFPTYFFFRTTFRQGPQTEIKPPFKGAIDNLSFTFTETSDGVYEYNKRVANADICELQTQLGNTDYKHLYLYMTLYPKTHRCVLMDILAKHDLHKYGALAWREFNRDLDRSKLTVLDSMASNSFKWQYWNPTRLYLDQPTENPGPIHWDVLPVEFNNSFVQLIGESLGQGVFITEKTVMPLIYNKPFLIMSGKYSHKHLLSHGFVLYDEIFDYSFDNLDDSYGRAEGIAQNLIELQKRIELDGYAKVLNTIRDKLIYNKKHAHTVVIRDVPNCIHALFNKPQTPYNHNRFIWPITDTLPYINYTQEFAKRFI